jgi:hypothetical protein
VNVFSLAFVWSISIGLAKYLFPAIGFVWHSDDVAHLIGVAAPAAASYFGHRAYTFSKIKEAADPVEGVCDPSVRGDPVN